jgi:hypothetical protein
MIEHDGPFKLSACPVELGSTYEASDLVDSLITNESQETNVTVSLQCNVETCAVRALAQRFEAPGVTIKNFNVYSSDRCKNS